MSGKIWKDYPHTVKIPLEWIAGDTNTTKIHEYRISEWVKQHFESDDFLAQICHYGVGKDYLIGFKNKSNATVFKLRWTGVTE